MKKILNFKEFLLENKAPKEDFNDGKSNHIQAYSPRENEGKEAKRLNSIKKLNLLNDDEDRQVGAKFRVTNRHNEDLESFEDCDYDSFLFKGQVWQVLGFIDEKYGPNLDQNRIKILCISGKNKNEIRYIDYEFIGHYIGVVDFI